MTTQVEFTGTATLTPKQLAQAFCAMKSDEQADFLQHVHDESYTWGVLRAQTQWMLVREDMDKRGLRGGIDFVRDLAFPWTLFSLWGDDFLERRYK